MMEENSSDEFGDCKKAKLDIKSSLQDVKPKIENITLKGEEPSKPWDVDHIGYKLDLDEESCAYNEIKTEPCLLEDAIKADAQDLQSYCVIEVEEKPCILALQAEVEAYSAKHRSGTQDACDQFSGRPVRTVSRKLPVPKKEILTNAERVKSWLIRLKEDPEAYQKHLQKQRERVRRYRSNLKLKERSLEEIERSRHLARIRQQRYVQKQKQSRETNGQTGQNNKKLDEKREYNRLAQQRCRSNWSNQKRTEINEKRREVYKS